MAAHSSVLAWRIPGRGDPGGLPSVGSQSWTQLKRLSSSRGSTEPPAVVSYSLSRPTLVLLSMDVSARGFLLH